MFTFRNGYVSAYTQEMAMSHSIFNLSANLPILFDQDVLPIYLFKLCQFSILYTTKDFRIFDHRHYGKSRIRDLPLSGQVFNRYAISKLLI